MAALFVDIDAFVDSLREDFHHGLINWSVSGEGNELVTGVVENFFLSTRPEEDRADPELAGFNVIQTDVFVGLSRVPADVASVSVWLDLDGNNMFEAGELLDASRSVDQ